jgi:hypothetical protein
MALPLQYIIGFILGYVVCKFLGKYIDEIIKGIVVPKQKVPEGKIICSQCKQPIDKSLYLGHLQSVHGIDVKAFYENLTKVN